MLMSLVISRKAIAFLVAFFGFAFIANAQQVTGTVYDTKGMPLEGISVIVRGTTTGTSTDDAGKFTIPNAANGSFLEFSGTGYEAKSVRVSGSTMTVALSSNVGNLNDVVVTGYGASRKKDVTGAIGSVSAKDFNRGFVTAPDQLIQNKVAGLEITSNSGQPGVATTIKIRGNNSIRAGGAPLYVIDGIPLDGRTARPGVTLPGFGASPESNPLLYINPNDIAQIDILKDASSAAIYGSRGANGVIAITTKKALAGQTSIEFGSSFGISTGYMHKYEILDANQYRSALTKYNAPATNDFGGNVDALEDITQNNLSKDFNLAVSSGNENGRFRASFLGSQARGFIKNSELRRYLGSFNGQYGFLDKKLNIEFHGRVGNTTEDIVNVSNNAGSEGNLISAALSWNPTQPYRDATTGKFTVPGNGGGNPLALLQAYSDVAKVVSFLGDISASYKITKGLEYKYLFGINTGDGTRNTNVDGWIQGYTQISGSGIGTKSYARLNSQTINHTLNYITSLSSKLDLNALAGYEYFKTDYEGSGYTARGFNTNLDELNLTNIKYTDVLGNGTIQQNPVVFRNPTSELQSYFGRVILNYDSKYILTATLRADGSSKFGSNQRYGYFPSVAAKWNISAEDFMQNSKISNLGLRASYGVTGNQEFPAGAAQEQYGFTATSGQTNVANPDLKWEETTSYNVGLDFGFMNGRVSGAFDYYNKSTSDILFQSVAIQPAPAANTFVNLPNAKLINRGVEFFVNAGIIRKSDFNWDVNFNFSKNDNELTNFTLNGNDILINTGQINGQGVTGTLAQAITNNQPVNVFYLKEFGGFDANGNQIIGANPIFAGDPNPHTLYGIGTSLSYKKFNVTINGGGASGYKIYNNTATNITNIAGILGGRNIDLAAFNSDEKPSSGAAASTRFLEDGSYFKLRNATLRYTIGDIGQYLKGLSVYVGGNNLFVLTKFTGFDPEVNIDKSNNNYPSRSIEYIPYPTPRTLTFGFNVSL